MEDALTEHDDKRTPTDAIARYSRVAKIAIAVGYRLLKQQAGAEDLVHEVWLAVEAHVADIEAGNAAPLVNFDAWVQRVATNKASKLYRSKWQRILRSNTPPPEQLPRSFPPPDEVALGQQLGRRLTEALTTLSTNQRLAFELYYQGHSYDEIAAATGAPLGTVKVRLHRPRARLAEILLGSHDGGT